MDTKALRQKILDLAIRGKLVPQNPDDEPASALLERIRQKKQQMVKDGKLKAKDVKSDTIIFRGEDNLHYEKFQDGTVKCIEEEIPFEVPKGWEWTRMASVCEFITSGSRGWAKYYADKGCLFIRMGNLSRDSFKLHMDNVQRVNLPSNVEGTRTRVLENDLLFSITAEIGMLGLIPINFEEAYINQHVGLIRFLKDTQTKYFPFILMSEFCKSQYYTVQSGMKNSFRLDNIQRILVPIPPFVEQKQIAKKIEDIWDTIVTIDFNAEYVERLVTQTKIKILDLAVRGQLVSQDSIDEPASALLERIRAEKEKLINEGKIKRNKMESIIYKGDDNSYYEKIGVNLKNINDELPYEIPESWSYIRLNTALSYEQPTPYIVVSTEYDDSYATPVLTAGKSFVIGYTNEIENTKSDLPVIIFDDFTTDSKYVNFPFKVKSSAMKILSADKQLIDMRYAYYAMQTIKFSHSTHKRYWISEFSQKIIALPPINEQLHIVKTIEQVFEGFALVEKSLR
ncbi:MAG: restriction endonuclease subunit S [Mobilitalea sp.]